MKNLHSFSCAQHIVSVISMTYATYQLVRDELLIQRGNKKDTFFCERKKDIAAHHTKNTLQTQRRKHHHTTTLNLPKKKTLRCHHKKNNNDNAHQTVCNACFHNNQFFQTNPILFNHPYKTKIKFNPNEELVDKTPQHELHICP